MLTVPHPHPESAHGDKADKEIDCILSAEDDVGSSVVEVWHAIITEVAN